MKLTLIFTMLVFFTFGNGFSQAKVTLHFEKATIQQVLKTLEDQTGHVFLYKDDIFDPAKRYSVNFSEELFKEVLKSVCETAGVDYEVRSNRQIILTMKEKEAVKAITFQQRTVTGVVTDQSGQPLPGVTVVVAGTTTGTVTNGDGEFSLTIPDEAETLQFSFVGMKTQEVQIGDRTTFTVVMEEETIGIEEVVAVGYGTMKKSDLTGAISSIKGSSILKGDPVSFQSALAGRAAGVQVTQTDNSPGAPINILIRGGSSLTSGNQPLFVIDGFPILSSDDNGTNPLLDLSPSQIESMEILKDASATAIYGALGSNGVVIITTKMGSAGTPKLTANASYGISELSTYPNILSPTEYVDYMIDRSQLMEMTENLEYWQQIKSSGNPGNIWIEEITRKAQTINAEVALSGGGNGAKYAISTSFLDQEGIIINSKFNRINLNANFEQKIGKKIKFGSSMRMAISKNEGIVEGWNENTIIKKALQTSPYLDSKFNINEPDTDNPAYSWNNENVVDYLDEVDKQFESTRLIGNVFLEYDLLKDLKFRTQVGLNRYVIQSHDFYSSNTMRAKNVRGEAHFNRRQTNNFIYNAQLNYNKTIFEYHNFAATAVFEIRKNDVNYLGAGVNGFENEDLGVYDLSSAQTALLPSHYYNDDAMASYLGRVNYNYKRKYLLTVSLRADASSKFGKDNKWGYFPSFAAGWLLSEEDFIKQLNVFDYLKFRLSYGITGNSQIPSYGSLSSLMTQKYVFDNTVFAGKVPGSVANPNLRWEKTNQYNLGTDFAFYNGRLSFVADAYYKKTTDLLLDVQLPNTSGYSSAKQNIGSISNKGLEFAINTVNLNKTDLKWNTSFTFSMNRSKVLDLGEKDEMFFNRNVSYNMEGNEVIVRVGDPVGMYYGYIEDEILNTATEIANSPNQVIIENAVGEVKLYDVNGDGVINTMDKVPIGKTSPDFIGGLNNEFTYKNFDFSFFMRWSYGNDIINGNITFLDRVGQGNWNTLRSMASIVYSPTNPEGTFHHAMGNNTYATLFRSSFVEDGSFLKMDYITLGYTFRKNTLNKKLFDRLRVYGKVNNPFMITRYSWWDPEVSTGSGTNARVGPGADVGTYPRSTSYILGISIDL